MVYPDAKHDKSLELGNLYEDIIGYLMFYLYGIKIHFYRTKEEQFTIGESEEGLEVKLDLWCMKSRRLSIETGEKTSLSQREFIPSGIMRQDNTKLYAQGDFTRCWVFFKKNLVSYFNKNHPQIIKNNPKTIQKFYISISEAMRISWHSFDIHPFVCAYGMADIKSPQWDNCLLCHYYKNEHCYSTGAELQKRFEKLSFKEETNGRKNNLHKHR